MRPLTGGPRASLNTMSHDATHSPAPADTGPVSFSAAALAEYRQILTRYPERRAALMPTLWLAQREFGWLSPSALEYVSGLMELPPAWVEGVATFYTMYWKRPMGRHHVAVCTNLSCYLRGAEQVYEAVCQRTGATAGGVSEDGKWSVERAECLGSCDTAPMLQLDNDGYYENLTVESTLELLGELERGNVPTPTALAADRKAKG